MSSLKRRGSGPTAEKLSAIARRHSFYLIVGFCERESKSKKVYDSSVLISTAGGAGGTYSIAVLAGHIYVAHSNPNDTTQPTDYLVTLDASTLTAHLTAVFYDNTTATNALTGATVRLGLTDPDTNFVMPLASPYFAGDLATISQGDGHQSF